MSDGVLARLILDYIKNAVVEEAMLVMWRAPKLTMRAGILEHSLRTAYSTRCRQGRTKMAATELGKLESIHLSLEGGKAIFM